MDCETFDRDVVDLLYEDGDAASREALTLHAATCAKCAATLASLKSTRTGLVSLAVEPPEGLTTRILEAEAIARRPPPLSRRVARGASWAGSLAMRPQFAMAAIFCIAVGSSLLLLRAREGSVPSPMSVRDVGTPALEAPSPPPAAAPAADEGYGAKQAARVARPEEAQAPADSPKSPAATAMASASPPAAPAASTETLSSEDGRRALEKAMGELKRGGCEIAAPDLRTVAGNYPDTLEGKQAARELETCAHANAPAGPPAKSKDGAPPPGAGSPPSAAPGSGAPR